MNANTPTLLYIDDDPALARLVERGMTRLGVNVVHAPGGEEGLLDVRVLEAIERALETGQPQTLPPAQRSRPIDPGQGREFPLAEAPELIDAKEPGEG